MNFPENIPFVAFLLFVITLSIKMVVMKKQGIKVSVKSGKKNHPLLLSFFIIFFLIWLFEISKPVFFGSIQLLPVFLSKPVFNIDILKLVGLIVVATAFIFWVTTLIHFKTSLRFGLDKNNAGKMITSGVFSISRNPFFLSVILLFTGIALIIPNWFFIGYALLSVCCIHLFILKEEKHLWKVYGKNYEDYRKKVRRYF